MIADTYRTRHTMWLVLIVILWMAFALRVVYMTQFVFHEDEFHTMLAVSRTAEQGVPTLPSGLFYDKGLAYTYLAALLSKLVGFSALLARWPSILAGVIGVAAMYVAGRGLFGALWVASEADFHQVLGGAERVWFVVRESQLAGNFTTDFIQQILAQMQPARRVGDVLVFNSVSGAISLPQEPDHSTDWQWEGGVQLVGYSAARLDKDSIVLTLFWRNIPLSDDFKVFIHLCSPDGVNLMQADHAPLAGLPSGMRRAAWGDGGMVRDQTVVSLPPGVDLTRDRFIIGIYHARSGERLSLLNDQSGEFGVWLDGIE